MNDLHVKTYYLGIFIVSASHIYFLTYPDYPINPYNVTIKNHSYANLAAAAMIAYYFMTKEGYLENKE
jgi:hypothetical protein